MAGKTVAVHLKPGTELDKVTGEVANYKLFKQIVGEIVEVSEAICGARRVVPLADDGQPPTQPAGEGGLFSQLQAEFAAEVARLTELVAGSLGDRGGQGLAAVELAIGTAMSKLGALLLGGPAGPRHQPPRVEAGAGHQANFVAYRSKNLDTVLGPVTLGRAYYHCGDCGVGVVPKDNELGVTGASLSPGLRAMVARVGAATPFAKASDLLTELAGVELSAKRVERSAEADGTTLVAIGDAEAAAVLTGRLVPLGPAKPVAKLYVAIDGTGVPTVPADTAGRAGKYPDGRARTREVKLGVLFTQTGVDDTGHPVRDPGSSSYVATLQAVEHFGSLVYAEARRRACAQARQVVVLGDGAPRLSVPDHPDPRQ